MENNYIYISIHDLFSIQSNSLHLGISPILETTPVNFFYPVTVGYKKLQFNINVGVTTTLTW